MTGDKVESNIAKMCASCRRLVTKDTLVCPSCGGILFTSVKLDTPNNKE